MKILIENVSIYSLPENSFIERGFLYLDKGIITSVNSGDPPLELEFADYIIDGRYSIVIPGFVTGIGDILNYMFRFNRSGYISSILDTLSLNDIEVLATSNMASFVLAGATSIVTRINIVNPKIVATIAQAATECWIRLRILIPADNIDADVAEEIIKTTLKSIKNQTAVSKGMITFGFHVGTKTDRGIIDVAKTFNARLYIDQDALSSTNIHDSANCTLLVNKPLDMDIPFTQKIVHFNPELWKPGTGLVSPDPLHLNPRPFIIAISKFVEDPLEMLRVMCRYNPLNLAIGIDVIESGRQADIIILDFSKPPTGPIPITEDDVAREIALINYTVDTAVIGGELVVDQGLILTVGDKHVKRARTVIESIIRKT